MNYLAQKIILATFTLAGGLGGLYYCEQHKPEPELGYMLAGMATAAFVTQNTLYHFGSRKERKRQR